MKIFPYNVKEVEKMSVAQTLNDFILNHGGEISAFLDGLSDEDVCAVCSPLGIDSSLVWPAIDLVNGYLKGEVNRENLLSRLVPIALVFLSRRFLKTPSKIADPPPKNQEKPTYSPTFDKKNPATEVLAPIADNDILYSLECYLE